MMQQVTIRKNFDGNILSQKSKLVPGSSTNEIKFLGALLAKKIQEGCYLTP
jgi:hypothetical protein